MQLLTALDVILGIILIYLIFSLIATAINEALAAILSSRAKWLRHGISALLATPGQIKHKPSGNKIEEDLKLAVDAFYANPFIRYLNQNTAGLVPDTSYISAQTALQGFLSYGQQRKDQDQALTMPMTPEQLRNAIVQLPNDSPIRVVLDDLWARTRGDRRDLEQAFETWFESFELQVSSWYRQKTQLVLSVIAVFLAVALNLDTIALVKQLATNKPTRDSVATLAQSATMSDVFDGPEYKAIEQARKDGQGHEALVKAQQAWYARLDRDVLQKLDRSGIQIGWDQTWLEAWEQARRPGTSPDTWPDTGQMLWLLSKLTGLLLTAAALTLGAPFWFDLLKKVASVRSVGQSLLESAAKPKPKNNGRRRR